MRKINFAFISPFIGLVLTSMVQAHTPLKSGGNESLASATIVPDPTKSYAIYAELHEGREAQYYQFNFIQGQLIHVSLFTTTSLEDMDFILGMVLMGPNIVDSGVVPPYVQIPSNVGAMVINGTRAIQATYCLTVFLHIGTTYFRIYCDWGTYRRPYVWVFPLAIVVLSHVVVKL